MVEAPRVVFVCSPYRGNVKFNVAVARSAAKTVFDAGCVPIVPHLYITRVLDDDVPTERQQGLDAGLVLLQRCDELWAFGEPSEGMRMEIAAAEGQGIPVVHHPLPRPAEPCWRCGGERVVKVAGVELPAYTPCPVCTVHHHARGA